MPPAPALVPSLDGIPGQLVLRPESSFWANIALWCDEAGLVKASDWKGASDAQGIALSALGRWSSRFAKLKHLSCSFDIDEADDHLFGYDAHIEDVIESLQLTPNAPHIAVTISANGFADRVIGPRVLGLEAEYAGLGETALAAIRTAANRTINVLDPAMAIRTASATYWYGEPCEAMALEEILAMGEEPESFGLVRLQDFHDLAPEWVWNPRAKLRAGRLAEISRDASRPEEVRQVASLCNDIFRLARQQNDAGAWHGPYDDSMYGIGMALWWGHDPGCVMQRVWDDHYQQIMQGGDDYFDAFGIDLFNATPEGFKSWVTAKSKWLKLASLQDSLIDLISEEVKKA